MEYTEEDLKLISLNQLNSKHYNRALIAINGLLKLLSRDWLINQIGCTGQYKGISELERLVFLWEDLELIKDLKGFEELLRKLKNGLRFENVDLEISIASDIIRCNSIVELEPLVGNDKKKSDCKFKINDSGAWTYVEITRKQNSTTQKLIDDKGTKLAELVSSIDIDKRCVLVIKDELNEVEFDRLFEWLKTKPKEGEFENKAVFFTVSHNTDETEQAFKYATSPISVRQGSCDKFGTAFGVVYLHIPDYGAEKKLLDKQKQLPSNEQGIFFIDLSNVAGGFVDWSKQINFSLNYEHFSAVVLLRDSLSSNGYNREFSLIKNENSKNPLSKDTIIFLYELFKIRKGKNLIED